MLTLTTTACHDNIYALIQQEVPQQTGLPGDILTIVPFKGYLYTANSKIYRKPLEESSAGKYNYQWSKVNAKCGEDSLVHIAALAADDNYLYCWTLKTEKDVDNSVNLAVYKYLYSSSDGENWTLIDISGITTYTDGDGNAYSEYPVILFDNKKGNGVIASSTSGRNAYVRIRGNQDEESGESNPDAVYRVYRLNGNSVPTVESSAESKTAAIYSSSGDRFYDSYAVTRNENCIYYASGTSIKYDNNGTDREIPLSSGTIRSIAATKDHLLIGTSSGIYRLHINETTGEPAASLSDFNNNAQTLLTSVTQCVYVLDASKNESETDEYAAMVIYGSLSSSPDSFDEIGLYAYYPGRGNWNRDGE